MPSEVILPRVDMDMATGKISKWLVEAGTAVTKGQPLFEIETDKATMEIEAEAAGTIRDLAEAGSADIPVGSVVAWIFAESEAASSSPAKPSGGPAKHRLVAEAAGVYSAAMSASAAPEPFQEPDRPSPAGRLRATPLARRLAGRYGIDLAGVTGSGPRGRIQAADIAEPSPAPAADPPRPGPDRGASKPAAAQGAAGLRCLRPGTGQPLLLVHGFGADSNSWRPFLQGQALDRPVFGLDLPGHGTAPGGDPAGFDALVEAAAAALTGLEGADVMAHSLGAAVAVALAGRGAADVRSLLLLAPAGLGPDINGAFLRGFLDATTEAALAPWMAELVADPGLMPASFVRATLRQRAGTGLIEAQRRIAAALFPDGTQAFSTRGDLLRLRIPVRVVFGTADRIIPAHHASNLPPLVALHRLPGVGHMPHMEAADMVAAILSQTMRR